MLAAILMITSCGKKQAKSYDEIALSGLTTRTENLKANLKKYADQGTIIGQHNATLEGVGWQCDSDRSDILSICGDRPAVIGYELAGIESGRTQNAEGLPFSTIRDDILQNFRRGALIVAKWTAPDHHGDDDLLESEVKRLAAYLASLHDGYGIKAPVVLFLYPLDGQSWYSKLSPDDYIDLYKQTQDLLDDEDVSNVVYGYSEAYTGNADYLSRYPDNDIDVINVSCLQSKKASGMESFASNLQSGIAKALPFAQDKNCALGLTAGMESVPDSSMYSAVLLPQLQQHRIAYLMFGRNHGDFVDGHFYVPYPGDGNDKIRDFMTLYNDERTVFMSRLNGLYLKH